MYVYEALKTLSRSFSDFIENSRFIQTYWRLHITWKIKESHNNERRRLRVSTHGRRTACAAIINAKCALIVALHRSAVHPRLTRINKTKMATAKREVSAQRFRKQLLISLPLSRPVARLIMNAPRRRAAGDQATRISQFFFLFSSRR